MSATLYEIREDLTALHDLLAEVGGDITESDAEAAIDAWLSETGEAVRVKLDGYAALLRELEARSEARRTEAARLLALAATDDNAAKRLEDRLLWFLRDQELQKVETARFRISVSRNGGKTPVTLAVAPDELPDAWRTQVTTYRAETDRIRAALERGESLPFASLGERGHHLRIR